MAEQSVFGTPLDPRSVANPTVKPRFGPQSSPDLTPQTPPDPGFMSNMLTGTAGYFAPHINEAAGRNVMGYDQAYPGIPSPYNQPQSGGAPGQQMGAAGAGALSSASQQQPDLKAMLTKALQGQPAAPPNPATAKGQTQYPTDKMPGQYPPDVSKGQAMIPGQQQGAGPLYGANGPYPPMTSGPPLNMDGTPAPIRNSQPALLQALQQSLGQTR